MNNVENRNQIIDIDGYVHVVNGKVICFKSDVYDLNNPDDVEKVLDTVSDLFGSESEVGLWFDEGTFAILELSNDNDVVVSMGDVVCLPEDVQKQVKLAILRYSNQIVDIDGYVHVVNGKVICFKPDVYDLNNSDDVEKLLDIASRMFKSKLYPAVYGNNTVLCLDNSDDEYKIISMACLEDFSDIVKRKVKAAVYEFGEI